MGFLQRLFSKKGSSPRIDDNDQSAHRQPANVAQELAEMDETSREGALGPRSSEDGPGYGNLGQPFFPHAKRDPNAAEEFRVAADREDDNAKSMLIERQHRQQERRD